MNDGRGSCPENCAATVFKLPGNKKRKYYITVINRFNVNCSTYIRCIMKATISLILLLILPALLSAQARTGVGLSFGVLKPFATNWHAGKVVNINGEFRIRKKTAIKVGLGINSAEERVFILGAPSESYSTGGMFFTTIEGKYYLKNNWFATGGMMLFMASDIYGGYGPTLSFGYRDNLNKHMSLEFAPMFTLLKADRRSTLIPIAGFSVSLYFSGKLKE